MVLPAELAEAVRAHLTRHVLRARVKVEDANSSWRCYGLTGPDAEAAAETRIHLPLEQAGFRQLIVAPRNEPLPEGHAASRAEWHIQDIEAGMPEVLRATSGEFVAQMLNLDAIGAIAFDKGCYTGQEIIARAHYRGQVKRRMQLFQTHTAEPLQPGTRITLQDGRRAQVVHAEVTADGAQQFLAVAPLPGIAATSAAEEPDVADRRVSTIQLPLPYTLPG
jgi:folate-binding protein YgfZ